MELYLASTTPQKNFVISHGENQPPTEHIWLCCFIFCVMALGARFAIAIMTPRIYRSATDSIRRALALATRKRLSDGSTHAGEPWFAIRVVLKTAKGSAQNVANLFQKLPMHGAQASFCSFLIFPLEQFTRTRHQPAHLSLAVLPPTRMVHRAARVHAAAVQYTRQGGYRASTAAIRMLRIFRRNFLSRSTRVDVHGGIHNFVGSHLCMKSKRFKDRSPDVNQKP
jgi:hypothetical protein